VLRRDPADYHYVNRVLFVLVAGLAVGASYWALLVGEGASPTLDAATIARIVLPGFVSAFVITTYIAWDGLKGRQTRGTVSELSAQLIRKEIEIGRLSALDELTGLYTRHHFGEYVQLEFRRAERYRRPVALLLIEVDDLAELGERVGKLNRGYLLSEVAAILRTMLRANDLGCRYTNDTLAALLPETDGPQSLIVADRVRTLVAEHDFLGQKHTKGLRITVSQGVAVVPSARIATRQEFLKAAEGALATARTSGRDQVQLHAPPPPRQALDGPPDIARLTG
jgi:diguanylate cyclase (GGDEF)-like protein